jgi:hypothetical protein
MLRLGKIAPCKSAEWPSKSRQISQPPNCVGGDTLWQEGGRARTCVAALLQYCLSASACYRFASSAPNRLGGDVEERFRAFECSRFGELPLLRFCVKPPKRESAIVPYRYFGEPHRRLTSFTLHRFGGYPLYRFAVSVDRHDLLDITTKAAM